MKYDNILLSADGDISVWQVPKEVADNLEKYCLEYLNWIDESDNPKAKRIRSGQAYFPDKVFIEYIEECIVSNCKCIYVETIDNEAWYDEDVMPDKYRKCSWFNF